MKKGLGRGLNALIPTAEAENIQENKEITTLKISQVEPNPNQPRSTFDDEKLSVLAESIKKHGVIQPILVKKNENGFYMIIAGERRWRAARMAGLREIPVVVKDYDDKGASEVSLIENLQREDLNPIEEAKGYERLMREFNMTQEDISERVGKSRPAITNTLRILNLSPSVIKLVEELEISSGHARALLGITDSEVQEKLAYTIMEKDLSVRQVEAMVNNIKKDKQGRNIHNKPINIAAMELERSLSSILGTKVRVTQGRNKGKIEIEFYDNESLEKIINAIKN